MRINRIHLFASVIFSLLLLVTSVTATFPPKVTAQTIGGIDSCQAPTWCVSPSPNGNGGPNVLRGVAVVSDSDAWRLAHPRSLTQAAHHLLNTGTGQLGQVSAALHPIPHVPTLPPSPQLLHPMLGWSAHTTPKPALQDVPCRAASRMYNAPWWSSGMA